MILFATEFVDDYRLLSDLKFSCLPRYVFHESPVILLFYLGVAIKWLRSITPSPSVCKPLAAQGLGANRANDATASRSSTSTRLYLYLFLSYIFLTGISVWYPYLSPSSASTSTRHFRTRFFARMHEAFPTFKNLHLRFFYMIVSWRDTFAVVSAKSEVSENL